MGNTNKKDNAKKKSEIPEKKEEFVQPAKSEKEEQKPQNSSAKYKKWVERWEGEGGQNVDED